MRKLAGVAVLILCGCASAQAQTPADPYADIVGDVMNGTRPPSLADKVLDKHTPPTPAPTASWFGGWFGKSAEQINAEGMAKLNARQFKEAISLFSEAIKKSPDVPKYHMNLGTALARARVYDQAADEFRAALKLDPATPNARQNLALATQRVEEHRAEILAEEIASRAQHD